MKVEEKLEQLGYLIFIGENNVNIGCKYLNNTYIHIPKYIYLHSKYIYNIFYILFIYLYCIDTYIYVHIYLHLISFLGIPKSFDKLLMIKASLSLSAVFKLGNSLQSHLSS